MICIFNNFLILFLYHLHQSNQKFCQLKKESFLNPIFLKYKYKIYFFLMKINIKPKDSLKFNLVKYYYLAILSNLNKLCIIFRHYKKYIFYLLLMTINSFSPNPYFCNKIFISSIYLFFFEVLLFLDELLLFWAF